MVLAGPIASAICGLTLFPGIPSSLVGSFIICSPTDASQMWNHWEKCLGYVFRPHCWSRYFLNNGLLGKHPLKSYLLPCIHILIYLIFKKFFSLHWDSEACQKGRVKTCRGQSVIGAKGSRRLMGFPHCLFSFRGWSDLVTAYVA